MIALYLFSYFSILIFIALVLFKVIRYALQPMHLRWDLYPVAHEPKRNKYGGSYYEESDWWEKEIKKDHLAEFLAMAEEIFLLKGVYNHNKKLWYLSYPFHLGLYLMTGTFFLIAASAILNLNFVIYIENIHTVADKIFYYLTNICGYAGLALTFIGCVGLLIKRASDKKYKFYNTASDYINLSFILVLVVSIFVTLVASNPSFVDSKEYVESLLTFNLAFSPDTFFVVHIVLISVFLLYFPFTRMMHLFAKYFTYHSVRWEDEPNIRGGKMEKRIKEALNYGVDWSAPHLKTGKTWAEAATTRPPEVENAK